MKTTFKHRCLLSDFNAMSDYIYRKSGHICEFAEGKRGVKIPLWSRNNYTKKPDAHVYITLGLVDMDKQKNLFDKWHKETRHLYKTDFTKD